MTNKPTDKFKRIEPQCMKTETSHGKRTAFISTSSHLLRPRVEWKPPDSKKKRKKKNGSRLPLSTLLLLCILYTIV
jgi:hypothetical protein